MRRRKPHVIGIAGTTCSGKSLLARHLKEKFHVNKPVIISGDSYYRDLSGMPEEDREKQNFDVPDAIEFELLADQLRALSEGEEIYRPIYNFTTHTRETDSVYIAPSDLIIVEGLFVLYWEQLRDIMDTKVFVTISDASALRRRLERDVVERGRTRQSVLDQYRNSVKPMTDRYVLPTSTYADIIVSGEDPMDDIALNLVERIELPIF